MSIVSSRAGLWNSEYVTYFNSFTIKHTSLAQTHADRTRGSALWSPPVSHNSSGPGVQGINLIFVIEHV